VWGDHSSPVELPEDRHWWFASRTRALLAILDTTLPDRNLAWLDIGCGAGNMFHHLSRYGSVQGVEIDPRPVAVARQRGYQVEQGDASRGLSYPDASFDVISALDVIEHNQDDQAILREAHRLLKVNGYLVLTVPAFMWLWSHNDVLNAHVRRYAAGRLREMLQAAGFNIRRLTYNNFFIFPLAAAAIWLRRFSQRTPQLTSHHTHQEAYQVEMEPASPLVNTLLTGIGRLEALLLRRVDLPIGTSLIAIAQKRV